MSDRYQALLLQFPPRPITSEAQLVATQGVVDSLLDKGNLDESEQDYLNVLGTLIREYEQQQPLPDIFGVNLVKALLVEFGLRQKDLVPIFKTESIVSAILSGQRQLTVNHIQGLSKFFGVSPAAFFPN
jgi:HTH-type transcriptional regulator/antitoxin HigA